MKQSPPRDPNHPLRMTDLGFADARSRALDLAAYLDRLDRYGEQGDVRHQALQVALEILADEQPDKTRRILERLSDPTEELAESSGGKTAMGVWPGLGEEA